MIHSVKITGYRTLRKFSMENLRRVNLLVGRNNVGKTSALEALYLLSSTGDPAALWRVLMRRGEQVVEAPVAGRPFQPEVEPRHLFFGHEIPRDATASISTYNGAPDRSIRFEISEAQREMNLALFAQLPNEPEGGVGPRFAIKVTGNPSPPTPLIPLTARGALRQDTLQTLVNIGSTKSGLSNVAAHQYVTTESISIGEAQAAFNEISLSPREELVIRALQFVEPSVERVALAQGVFFGGQGWPTRGGLKVKLKDIDEPVPIGSMGEGAWRLLALAISLTRARDGVFMVDEIDIGLHFSMMPKLWRFIIETAQAFNIQVFATTHSLDCVRGLAALTSDNNSFLDDVSIQRLEPGHAMSYSEGEIVALANASRADEEIEVR